MLRPVQDINSTRCLAYWDYRMGTNNHSIASMHIETKQAFVVMKLVLWNRI